jgi:transcriptional regulator with XRE-family HTH domain
MDFDITTFLRRSHQTQKELAEKLSCSSGLVGQWASGRAIPSYEKIVDLLKLGMTVREIFGKDVSETALIDVLPKEKSTVDKDFVLKVGQAIMELTSGGIRMSKHSETTSTKGD